MKIECEECQKEIKRKNAIGLIVGGKVLSFFVCSYECLSLYVNKLCQHEELSKGDEE